MKPLKKKHTLLKIVAYSIVILVLILILMFVIGFARNALYRNSLYLTGSSKTTLTISRDNTLNQAGVSNFKIAVNNSNANILLKGIDSLHPVGGGPNATFSCPADDGVTYSLSFTNPNLSATFPAYGCQFVTVNNKTSYQSSSKFQNDITNATHQSYDPDTNF